MSLILRDPTPESAPAMRERIAPPPSLEGKTIALLDIGKTRSDEFLDYLETALDERGLTIKRYAKPTNAMPAPEAVLQSIAGEADVVIEALAD